MLRTASLLVFALLQSSLGQQSRESDPNVVAVGDSTQPDWRQLTGQQGPVTINDGSGLGLSATPVLRWGLGAVILMLIVSTVISLGGKILPTILDNLPREDGGR